MMNATRQRALDLPPTWGWLRTLALGSMGVFVLLSNSREWASAEETVAAGEQGARRLFDGATFAGWQGDTQDVWRIENGAITAGSHEKAAPRNEFLSTEREFENFELRLKYRIVGTEHVNAGVQIRTRRIPNHHEVSGYQADIGPGFDGALYDESRRNRMLATPEPEVVERALQAVDASGWSTYRIRAEGPRIRLWLNGVATVDYLEEDESIARSGVIALQIHGRMRAVIAYKDIEILELPASD